MAEDVTTVNQRMLRAWHERSFPGLTPEDRAKRIARKWAEESEELAAELARLDAFGDDIEDTWQHIREEAADVLITLMGFAEFAGFDLYAEAVKKFNVINNRV
jgi:NTP pyrophosphatase (non-canonical NTP hydrolase)